MCTGCYRKFLRGEIQGRLPARVSMVFLVKQSTCRKSHLASASGQHAGHPRTTLVLFVALSLQLVEFRMVGRIFLGRYETIRLLGEGGMGRVYLARQLDLGRNVVVKVMHEHVAADAKFRERF